MADEGKKIFEIAIDGRGLRGATELKTSKVDYFICVNAQVGPDDKNNYLPVEFVAPITKEQYDAIGALKPLSVKGKLEVIAESGK